MKKIGFIVILIILFQLFSSINIATNLNSIDNEKTDWWTCFHHDAQNTGCSSSIIHDTVDLLWTYDTGSSVRSSPAIVDDKVFIGCSGDKKVCCLDLEKGNEIWRYYTIGNVYTSPAIVDNELFFGDDAGIFYCLDKDDGSELWTHHFVVDPMFSSIRSSPTVWKNRVYFGNRDGRIFCLNAESGHMIWSRLTGFNIESCPAVCNGRVYFGDEGRRIHCIGAYMGQSIWSYKTGFAIFSSPAVSNNQVFIGSWDDFFYSLNAYTGRLLIQYPIGSMIGSSPAIWEDRIFFGSYDDKVYCLKNQGYGWKLWDFKTGDDVISSPAIADGKVYVGSADKNFYCLDALNGNLIWNFTTGGKIISSPAIADGKVCVGSSDGKLYCFGKIKENRIQIDARGPYNGLIGETMSFDAIISNGTPPYSWSWDFDDSDGIQSDSRSEKPIFIYNNSGWYNVTVQVIDAKGFTDSDKTKIAISNPKKDIIISKVRYNIYGLNAVLYNNGSTNAINIEWEINFNQGIDYDFFIIPTALLLTGEKSRGVIEELAPNESKIIKTSNLLGYGLIFGSISIEDIIKMENSYIILGPFLINVSF